MKIWIFTLVALLVASLSVAMAFENDSPLEDPLMESRARDLAKEIRCLVCQNQSIFDSDAELAKDLRQIVRERITLGDDDAAITEYLVARYGDFVLLKPPIKPKTYLLWFGPILIFLVAGYTVLQFFKNANKVGRKSTSLNSLERKRVKELISDTEVE